MHRRTQDHERSYHPYRDRHRSSSSRARPSAAVKDVRSLYSDDYNPQRDGAPRSMVTEPGGSVAMHDDAHGLLQLLLSSSSTSNDLLSATKQVVQAQYAGKKDDFETDWKELGEQLGAGLMLFNGGKLPHPEPEQDASSDEVDAKVDEQDVGGRQMDVDPDRSQAEPAGGEEEMKEAEVEENDRRVVYVDNMCPTATGSKLAELLGAAGDIAIIYHPLTAESKSTGHAKVSFVRPEDARKAVEMFHHVILPALGHDPLQVVLSSSAPLPLPPSATRNSPASLPPAGPAPLPRTTPCGRTRNTSYSGYNPSHRVQRPAPNAPKGMPVMWVCHLPKQATEKDVADLVEHGGQLESVELLRNSDGSSQGKAVVRYKECFKDTLHAVDMYHLRSYGDRRIQAYAVWDWPEFARRERLWNFDPRPIVY